MLAHERAERIVERLRERGTVSAQELVRMLRVSAPTIRRDLERLESEGVLRRVHGGAFLTRTTRAETAEAEAEAPFEDMVGDHATEKNAVAAEAAKLVQPGHVVLLDIGTTTMRIARQLRGRSITVITGNLAVLDVLRHDEVCELVLLGGSVRRNYQSLVGPLTEDTLASVRADIAFLSCTGVRPDGSVVDDISQEATLKRAIARSANRVVLAAPAAKFPGSGSLRYCRLDDLDDLITTEGADEPTLDRARQAGTNVIVA
jgi:DeoR/GlpR family transcriptional regulator of sugar metabolism